MNIGDPEIDGEASSDCAIVFTVDQKFLPFALFLIDQIGSRNPERNFDFCIVSTERLTAHPLIEKHRVRICNLSVESVLAAFSSSDRISVATYLGFSFPTP